MIAEIDIKKYMSDQTLSAGEACQLLGVTPATLYSYVSRGLLRSHSSDGARSKRYARDDVLRLAARRQDGRRAGHVAEQAIDWGRPVLESRITLIEHGVIRYRGRDALQLARHATLEETAGILWQTDGADAFAGAAESAAPAHWPMLRQALGRRLPLERAMALLAAWPPSPDLTNAQWMRILAAALLDGAIGSQPLHVQCRSAWGLAPGADAVLRAALVACADHELNVSAFTVRCVASSGAGLPAALVAGLAALGGPRHSGETLRVRDLIDTAMASGDIAGCLRERIAQADQAGFASVLPGFGHPLYPEPAGDPRSRLLLELLQAHAPRLARLDPPLAIASAGSALTGQAPNVDFGLAAIEYAFDLPRGAAQTLFALGRSAGWIGHAMEQTASGRLIRPRARYVGSFEAD
ncbi:merR regulatory family protein [Janthinobacterium agaricidamnosum NBRC 102515 = DSM 9628]|uniref:citrate synthase (unknown stereospecificity) n=2 Tax=Janthinobacterium agaricidamnosum TaxID=55508 RepID=W0V3N2_9BURK|nr:merR regulatory family protein [Janthinobacterium agaricidamnosum NBRC 102515 = DSM 9628]